MIIPSIDIMNGKAVQLRQGRDLLLTDPRHPVELAEYFGRFGPVAIVDLDAAFGQGENRRLIAECCKRAACRVGGGVRTEDDVRNLIRGGAEKVVIGTMATPDFLKRFDPAWIIAALDARGQDVVVEGWKTSTNQSVLDRARQLSPCCGEFLFTQVEREGMLAGPDLDTARALREKVPNAVTIAGGIRDAADLLALEDLGCSAQIGRALYEDKINLTDAWIDLVKFGDAGLAPTIVQDVATGDVLMLAYSNRESLRIALADGCGCYFSRSRNCIWRKGETSGHTQRLVRARCDCDRDCILFAVEQTGPACHLNRPTCFGDRSPQPLAELEDTLRARAAAPAGSSYTQRLLSNPELLAQKLREEIEEVNTSPDRDNLIWECADVLYHLLVRMRADNVDLTEVLSELRRRMRPST